MFKILGAMCRRQRLARYEKLGSRGLKYIGDHDTQQRIQGLGIF